jgi:immune inhibitor A
MMYYNKKVNSTFAGNVSQWAWAEIEGLGWKRIKNGAADGCTNLFIMMNEAKGSGKLVHVDIDTDNLITLAYLV